MKTVAFTVFFAAFRNFTLSAMLILGVVEPLFACDDWLAETASIEGLVQKKTQTIEWVPLKLKDRLCAGDSVRVDQNSRAALYLRNNTFVRLDANSIVVFPQQQTEANFWIELRQGLAHFISRISHHFEVATPYVNAAVEGTEFLVSANGNGAVTVVEGTVKAYNDKSSSIVRAGEQSRSRARDQPILQEHVSVRPVVEWAMYNPSVVHWSSLPTTSVEEKDALQQAQQAMSENRVDRALSVLDAHINSGRSVAVARASVLLQIGRMELFDQALPPLIDKSLSDKAAGAGYALNAVADAMRGQPENALQDAKQSVVLAPDQAASYLALSYAYQAALDLDQALKAAEKAVQVQPDSPLAHLRLSELYLANGDIRAAKRALGALPKNAAAALREKAQGYVALFSADLPEAQNHFEKALALDSANPDLHLGLGLTLLRRGDLLQGRQHLEYAVSLDPVRSVLRSYLARAYFEEKRDKLAVDQWELAKQFDPNDPTPWFYSGVYKLLDNKPLPALNDLEKSNELNDARALYRSETLLQSDSASRSAAIAHAYNDAGDQQGVLLHGWDAVRKDPTNAEGHRLLADRYAGDPRYETARASELLQSQMWQGLSAYPLQPQLTESDLSVVAGSGPQRPGLNEYHSLFSQNGFYGTASGYGGSDGTWGNDLVGSVLTDHYALGVGQYHYETNGWRKDADQMQDIQDVLVQAQVLPFTMIQLEARRFDWDAGDLTPRWKGKQTQILKNDNTRDTNRLGIRQQLSSGDYLLVSYINQEINDERNQLIPAKNENRQISKPNSLELQYVRLLNSVNLVFGARGVRADNSANFHLAIDEAIPELDVLASSDYKQQQDSLNFYMYSNSYKDISFVLGVDYDKFEYRGASNTISPEFTLIPEFTIDPVTLEVVDNSVLAIVPTEHKALFDRDYSQWSPKIGITLTHWEDLQIRVASYRTFSRSVVANQTIEPAMIAGFSQLFSDREALSSDNYGIALDYNAGSHFRVGASLLRRLFEGPLLLVEPEKGSEGTESLFDGYINYQVNTKAQVNVNLQSLEIKDDSAIGATDGVSQAKNVAVPVEFVYFTDSSLSLSITESYLKHNIDFSVSPDTLGNDRASVYVTDLKARFRLPQKRGVMEVGVKNLFDNNTEIVEFSQADATYLGGYPSRFWYFSAYLNL